MVDKKIVPGSVIDCSEEEKRYTEDRSMHKWFPFYLWSRLRYNNDATCYPLVYRDGALGFFLHRRKNIVWWASTPPNSNFMRMILKYYPLMYLL